MKVRVEFENEMLKGVAQDIDNILQKLISIDLNLSLSNKQSLNNNDVLSAFRILAGLKQKILNEVE